MCPKRMPRTVNSPSRSGGRFLSWLLFCVDSADAFVGVPAKRVVVVDKPTAVANIVGYKRQEGWKRARGKRIGDCNCPGHEKVQ